MTGPKLFLATDLCPIVHKLLIMHGSYNCILISISGRAGQDRKIKYKILIFFILKNKDLIFFIIKYNHRNQFYNVE